MANFGAHRLVAGALAVPFAYLLVEMGQPILAAFSLTGTIALVALPDMDRRLPGIPHRMTHSVLVMVLLAAVFSAGGWIVGDRLTLYAGLGAANGAEALPPLFTAVFVFAVTGQAFIGHILADMLTRSDVEILWPVLDRSVSVDAKQVVDPRANEGMYVVGTVGIAVGITAVAMALV